MYKCAYLYLIIGNPGLGHMSCTCTCLDNSYVYKTRMPNQEFLTSYLGLQFLWLCVIFFESKSLQFQSSKEIYDTEEILNRLEQKLICAVTSSIVGSAGAHTVTSTTVTSSTATTDSLEGEQDKSDYYNVNLNKPLINFKVYDFESL